MRKSGFLAAVLTAAFTLALVIPASAAPTPKATGSIGMEGPLQYISFNAFDYGASADDKGEVSYTNFDNGETGTDVWDVREWGTLWVTSTARTHEHAVTVDEIVPTSPMGYDFTAHGSNTGLPVYDWTMTGTVYGDLISFTLYQTGTSYQFWASGSIGSGGSMSGTATHSANAELLTWTAPAASASEVFHYEADVTCANVGDGAAFFTWTNSRGTAVTAWVTDGGSPGSSDNDTYAHGIGSDCDNPPTVNNYSIVSGNLVVH